MKTTSRDLSAPVGRKLSLALVAVVALVLALPGAAWSQYAIGWHKISGGGGTSSGGSYSLTGTIGQPDAGKMSGGSYSLEGGFLGGVFVIQELGAPKVTVSLGLNNTVVLAWPSASTDAYDLQFKNDLNAAQWTASGLTPQVQGDFKVVTVNLTTQRQFFRLYKAR